jgi:hypothetical protein
MIVNLHSICLDPCNGRYEEYPLLPEEEGTVLPGAIVAIAQPQQKKPWGLYEGVDGTAQSTGLRQSETTPPTADGKILVAAEGTPEIDDPDNPGEKIPNPNYKPAYYVTAQTFVTSQAVNVGATELLVVTENSYEHGSINHKCIPGEIVHIRRAVSADRYLLRAVAGSYVEGDPLYLTQTANGIYVTKTGAEGAKPIGYAGETYVVYGEDNETVNPKFYYDAVDDSTPIRPSSRWLNGAVFNLLKVRIA